MDVVSPLPVFNLYNFDWPIYTSYGPQPPAKLVQGAGGEKSSVDEAVLSPGVVVTGGKVKSGRCCRPAVRVGAGAEVIGSVLMNGVRIGDGAVVRNAILDKNVVVPPGAQIGVDLDADRARGFLVEDGLTVLGKDQAFPRTLDRTPAARAAVGVRRPRACATVSCALSPLGFGTIQSSAPGERLGLPAGHGLRAARTRCGTP